MLRIVFMGTPEFAVASLQSISENFEVIAVVTAPDKQGGRGHHLIISPIKKWATDHKIPVLQPTNLKSLKFLNQLYQINADLFVVVAFRMLPESVWSIPKYGTINLHASLLPKYRGAAPIQRAIMAGEKITGLTTFKLNKDIDTGDLLDQISIPISEDQTGGELHDQMMHLGAKLLVESVIKISKNEAVYFAQNHNEISHAPKIFTEDCKINWNNDVKIIYNHIRALIPFPGPWFEYQNKIYKIYKARKSNELFSNIIGQWHIKENKLFINCLNGSIEVLEIQMEGKRKMEIAEFLRGYKNIN